LSLIEEFYGRRPKERDRRAYWSDAMPKGFSMHQIRLHCSLSSKRCSTGTISGVLARKASWLPILTVFGIHTHLSMSSSSVHLQGISEEKLGVRG
jgi:hypothetical protein